MGDLSWGAQLPSPELRPELTEKALVLESFAQFAQDKLEETPALKFEGGEIVLKEDPTQLPLTPQFASRPEWEQAQSAKLGSCWQTLVNAKNAQPLVLFIGESIVDSAQENEFALCFAPGVAELFQKMVQAMKLTTSEYVLTTLRTPTSEKSPEELFEETHWWRPRFVVPLGAQACQALLGPRERLAAIHGKSFTLPRLPVGTEIVPLFHPGVIATNANMKKATWTDMQRLMKLLGKV